MPRTCTVCAHAQREAIEAELVGPGQWFRNIAERFLLSPTALHRHKTACQLARPAKKSRRR